MYVKLKSSVEKLDSKFRFEQSNTIFDPDSIFISLFRLPNYIITFFNSIEQELFKYKAELHNCQLESENDKKRIEELEAENLQLQMSSKSSISESQSILAEMENIRNRGGQTDTNILTEQLGEGMYLVSKFKNRRHFGFCRWRHHRKFYGLFYRLQGLYSIGILGLKKQSN